ncbi:MAG: glycosyltransferase family 9 protein [Candidatus Omnitrophica bacterium]|nr:glycosyltransferase family 9 protein [Candidatus Omnitrophota bacterium]
MSNIGDVILTFPVFDALAEAYPQALFSVVVSPKAKSFFEGHKRVKRVHILEKQSGVRAKVQWLSDLRREKFDLVVDMRNSMLPFLVRSRRRTRPVLLGESNGHMRDRHLRRLRTALKNIPLARDRHSLYGAKGEEQAAGLLLHGLKNFVLLAPGAADARKQWTSAGFSQVIRFLVNDAQVPVVLVGDRKDLKFAEQVMSYGPVGVLNLCGKTSLKELAFILNQARLAVVNDSGVMHLASYLDIPTIALFGPTDPDLYGPWGKKAFCLRSPTGRMADIGPRMVIDVIARELT